jgi:hypothetical protein
MGLKHESRGAARARWRNARASACLDASLLRSGALQVLSLAVVLSGVAPSPGRAEEAAPPSCEDCSGTRKVRCGSCNGRGEIYSPCTLCKGSGKKPCPVCAEPEDGRSPTPGKIPCSLCKGKGIRESTGKACSRCRGNQATSCTACAGKGTLRCRKEIYVEVCPDCSFAGKVACPTCDPGRVTRSDGVEEEAAATEAEEEEVAPSSSVGRSKLPPELEARYRKLTALHDGHMDIFAIDAERKAEAWRSEAARLERKLEDEGRSAEEIEKLQARVTRFRIRYAEIRDVFLESHRAYRNVASVWKSRDRALEAAHPSRRSETERELDERMEIVLSIAEQKAARLEAEKPTWLLKEIEDLAVLHGGTKTAAEGTLADAEKAAKEEKEARRVARDLERQRRAAEKASLAAKRPRRSPDPAVAEPEEEEEEDVSSRPAVTPRAARKPARDGAASRSEAVLDARAVGIWMAGACAIAGFAAVAALVLRRKRSGWKPSAADEPETAARV